MRPERTHRRGWRWFKRAVLGLLALIVVVVGAAVIAVHTDWGRGIVRAQVEARLQEMFTGGATLGRLEGSPFGALTLHDLVINGPDREPAIAAKTVEVDVGLLPLLSHQARVLAVRANEVDVDLKRDANGELQITRLMRPGPKSAWSVDLPRVELRRAHLRFDTGSELMNIDALTVDGRAKLPHGGPIDASIELHGTWRERATPLDLKTVVHSDDAGLVVPSLAATAGEVSVLGHQVTVVWSAARRTPAIGGTLIVRAPAAAVARLVPAVQLPADLAVTISATPLPGQRWTNLVVVGTIDKTAIGFVGAADLDGRHARGQIETGTLDVTKLSRGKVRGEAAINAVFDIQPGGERALPFTAATIRGWGALDGFPRTSFAAEVRSAGQRLQTTIDASGDGLRARIVAALHIAGDVLAIEDATVHATADPAVASAGKAPVHGALRIDLKASGAVRPAPSLAVSGTIEGKKLRMQDLSVSALHVAIDAKQLPNRPLGHAHVQAIDLVRQDAQLGELTVDATDRADGRIAVSVRSRPKQNPWLVDADALVTPPAGAGPGSVAIDLLRHRVRAGSGEDWTGRTGHVDIKPERIVVRDLNSASRLGRLAISGSYERAGRRRGDLAADIEAKALSLDNIAGSYHGRVDAHVTAQRRAGAWTGEAELSGTGVQIEPSHVVIDGKARVALHDRRLEVTADGSSVKLGSVALAVDLEAPVNVADPAAWKRLDRTAIRTGQLTLRGIEVRRAAELAGLEGDYEGRINGDVRVSADTTGGRVEVTGLVAPQLRGVGVNAVLDLSQTSVTELTPTLSVTADGIGRASVQAQLEMPDRLFDPAAWARLGRGALRGATVRTDGIAFDPAMLARFGILSDLRGKVSVSADIGEAARTVKAAVDVAQLRGGPIAQPLDIHLETALDERATAALSIKSKGAPLVELSGRLPVSLAQLLDSRGDLEAIKATRLDATAELAQTDAPRLLAVFGRTEIIAGTINGSIALTGTIGTPMLKADLVAVGLKVPPGPRGKPIRTVERLAVAATWDGKTAKLDVDGVQAEGGKLKIAGEVSPARLRDGTLTLTATKLDLVPIMAFLPGPAGGAAGQLDADLRLQGLDLRTTQLAGELHLADARLPIAPSVGTLRRAKIDAVVADNHIMLKLDGRLGAGSVVINGSVALDGAAPNSGKAKITLRKVSPIGTVEPEVNADVTATLSRDGDQWRADLVVDNGHVVVPKSTGEKLKPVGAPTDMRFITGERITRRPMEKEAPSNPIIVAKLVLRSTQVESEEFRGLIRGQLEVRADGDSIGVFGSVEADRGDLDLFGRRYYVERAAVNFDGSTDPLLDIRISHEFADVTTVTEVHGRASAPELSMSSDPGTYSQDQLLGFLLGGEPGGDPHAGATTDKVAGAGESYIANKIGGYVRDALPIDIDVLRYEAATSTSSAAVLVGTWVTQSLFLAYRQHLESRPDENTGEGELEYWISRRVVIEATAGDRGYNGLDLLWRKRY